VAAAAGRMALEEFGEVHQSPGIWSPEKFSLSYTLKPDLMGAPTCPDTIQDTRSRDLQACFSPSSLPRTRKVMSFQCSPLPFLLPDVEMETQRGKSVESCPGVALCSWLWRVPGNPRKGRSVGRAWGGKSREEDWQGYYWSLISLASKSEASERSQAGALLEEHFPCTASSRGHLIRSPAYKQTDPRESPTLMGFYNTLKSPQRRQCTNYPSSLTKK